MYDPELEGPSKSQRKRDMDALQDLGEQLTALTPAALKKCELPDEVLDAIREYQRLPNKHGARRRQLQYIGKVMRMLDEADLKRISAQITQDVSVEKRRFMALEELRTGLLAEDKAALEQLLQEHPQTDARQIRQLVEQAHKEQAAAQTPLASRKLFQLLRQLHGV
jgi:ribosome-associated protein